MQENEKVRINLMQKIQAEATSSSLGESVKNLSQAIMGLNSIKEQYAGNPSWNNLVYCFFCIFHNKFLFHLAQLCKFVNCIFCWPVRVSLLISYGGT